MSKIYLITITALLLWVLPTFACTIPGDGQGHGPAMSFTDNHNGTVTDNLTGLTWTIGRASDGKVTWSNLHLPAGWRLPNLAEALSIVDYGHRSPAVPTQPFGPLANMTDGVLDEFWNVDGSSVDENGGGATTGVSTAFVRYVSGRAPCMVSNYVDNGNGTITDHGTDLMWAKTVGVDYTWDGANTEFVSNINELAEGGYRDWRLPTVKELITAPQLPVSGWFWSSTPHAQLSGPVPTPDHAITCAWGVSSSSGWVYHNDRGTLHYARAVRP